MISDESLRAIAEAFCGDTKGYYSEKSGSKLVDFFNNYFDAVDVYKPGFPTRWRYVYDKIAEMIKANTINKFLDLILGKAFLMRDLNLDQVGAAEKAKENLEYFNSILAKDLYTITHREGHYFLVKEDADLELIGEGGFANVFRQKSTGLVVKKLKDEYLSDSGIRSRFKREFNITESLQDNAGIVRVYTFDEGKCTYTMEYAECTLEKYIRSNKLTDDIKERCIRQILRIMSEVHSRNIIHRDLSPNNIFIIAGRLKIADFGLGKDLSMITSHQTFKTNAVGQYFYCAPEQFMMLKDADKRSDVFSLGCIINFIMTCNPRDSHHIYSSVAEKARNSDAAYRYADAEQLSKFFEKSVEYHKQGERKELIQKKIHLNTYDDDVESYIYNMAPDKLCRIIMEKEMGFENAVLRFMGTNEDHAQHIIQSIEGNFRECCGWSYEANDPFASISAKVLRGKYSFVVKETAATILRYIAWDVRRFSAQDMVAKILDEGIDPMLEDILKD